MTQTQDQNYFNNSSKKRYGIWSCQKAQAKETGLKTSLTDKGYPLQVCGQGFPRDFPPLTMQVIAAALCYWPGFEGETLLLGFHTFQAQDLERSALHRTEAQSVSTGSHGIGKYYENC